MSKLIKSISNSIRRGYQAGISGDTYYDMMRQCTLKTMFEPSYELNRRVVECIIHESCGPVREAVRELKDRLQQENPFKAYLAVKLTEQVLDEAGEAVAVYTMEILEEVARVATRRPRPGAGGDPQGNRGRIAAMELLQRHPLGEDAMNRVRQGTRAPPAAGGGTAAAYYAQHPGPGGYATGYPIQNGSGFAQGEYLDDRDAYYGATRESMRDKNAVIMRTVELLKDVLTTGGQIEWGLAEELEDDLIGAKEYLDRFVAELAQETDEDAQVLLAETLSVHDELTRVRNMRREKQMMAENHMPRVMESPRGEDAAVAVPPPSHLLDADAPPPSYLAPPPTSSAFGDDAFSFNPVPPPAAEPLGYPFGALMGAGAATAAAVSYPTPEPMAEPPMQPMYPPPGYGAPVPRPPPIQGLAYASSPKTIPASPLGAVETFPPPNTPQSPPNFGSAFPVPVPASPPLPTPSPTAGGAPMRMNPNLPARPAPPQPPPTAEKHSQRMFKDLVSLSLKEKAGSSPGENTQLPLSPNMNVTPQPGATTPLAYRNAPGAPANTPSAGGAGGASDFSDFAVVNNSLFGDFTPRPMETSAPPMGDAFDVALKGRI